MGTFRGGIAHEAVAVTVPAVADGGRGAAYFDQPNFSSWQGLYLYRSVNLGWAGPATIWPPPTTAT